LKWLEICALVLNGRSAFAQFNDNPLYVTASYATSMSRYYAPYALQAAAAYLPVKDMDQTRDPSAPPGADVTLATSSYERYPQIRDRAQKILQGWRYQFGSEGYLLCFESDADCQNALRADRWTWGTSDGPAFHVWARTRAPQRAQAACSEVSIAFRGTVGSVGDWVANAHPVTSYLPVFEPDDHYRQLRRNIDAIIRKIATLDCYRRARRTPQIVSVGHSLGGGLAQFAALANRPDRPRIAKVFAFDTSPVTATDLIDKRVLARNARELEIDRVHQTGEALQYLRRGYEGFPKSSSTCKPLVRNVVFDALPPGSVIDLHSMAGLAGRIVHLSDRAPQELPLGTNCPTRYRAPLLNQDEAPDPDLRPDMVRAPAQSLTAFARAGRTSPTTGDVRGNWFGTAFVSPAHPEDLNALSERVRQPAGAKRASNVSKRQVSAGHAASAPPETPGEPGERGFYSLAATMNDHHGLR
jgi:pimeloyl-ACP methyl ester carboxylesterase